MITREPHRNVLSTQEYRSAQQRREIKKLIDLRRRNVGETRREKTKSNIFSPFSFNTKKCQGQVNVGKLLVKYQGKNKIEAVSIQNKRKLIRQHLEVSWQYRSKNCEHVSIDRKLCSKEWISDHYDKFLSPIVRWYLEFFNQYHILEHLS